MIWFSLRQFRTQAAVAFGVLVVLTIGLFVTGPHLVHLYDTSVAVCSKYNDCGQTTATFLQNDHTLSGMLNVFVIVVPAIIGLFWGAPLIARELEGGTFRLAWTQSVTRSRWLVAKISVVGLASMATVGLLSLMVTWWSSPLDTANMSLFSTFDERGIVPIGYAAFAFALGITAGVLIRRTLPAMATTLVAFVAARLAIVQWIRPHLVSPVRLTTALNASSIGFGSKNGGPLSIFPGSPNIPNALIYSTQFVDKAGNTTSAAVVTNICPQLADLGLPGGPSSVSVRKSAVRAPNGVPAALQNCVTKLSRTYHVLVTYQPSRHYWPMQWIELGIYLAVALGLGGLCYWWVQRRIT
jgi:hypothetical protein